MGETSVQNAFPPSPACLPPVSVQPRRTAPSPTGRNESAARSAPGPSGSADISRATRAPAPRCAASTARRSELPWRRLVDDPALCLVSRRGNRSSGSTIHHLASVPPPRARILWFRGNAGANSPQRRQRPVNTSEIRAQAWIGPVLDYCIHRGYFTSTHIYILSFRLERDRYAQRNIYGSEALLRPESR